MLFTWSFLGILSLAYAFFRSFSILRSERFLSFVSIIIVSIWSWQSALLAIALTALTYWGTQQNKVIKYGIVGAHIVTMLGGLQYFKTQFSLEGGTVLLGLSYYALHNISVLLQNQKTSFPTLTLNNLFFPRFFAGPILQHSDNLELNANFETDFAYGTQRILYGLAKKFILADRLSIAVDNLLLHHHSEQSYFTIAFGACLFTIEMYLDFSAYCDIAIGTGRLFGIRLPENFNLPLRSKSVTEYWRKTHITLIKWLTTNCYYPILYRFRKQAILSVTLGILCTFVLSGIWHGLLFGFLLWGTFNAAYLISEFLWGKITKKKLTLGTVVTFLLISFSNLFFKLGSMEKILSTLGPRDNNLQLLPSDWMVEFVAVMGNGGHLLQQYNIVESSILLLIFLLFESKLEAKAKSKKLSFAFLSICIFSIVFWGNFNAGQEFIYVQF